MCVHGYSWLYMSTYEPSSHEQPWVAMNTTEQPWVAMNTHENGTLSTPKDIWAWYHGAMSTYENSWDHLTILLNASECFWVIMNAHESSFTFMSANECLSTWLNNYWKMLILRMNTLQYFCNNSVQISLNNKKLDIFEICTKRAVGKWPRLNF